MGWSEPVQLLCIEGSKLVGEIGRGRAPRRTASPSLGSRSAFCSCPTILSSMRRRSRKPAGIEWLLYDVAHQAVSRTALKHMVHSSTPKRTTEKPNTNQTLTPTQPPTADRRPTVNVKVLHVHQHPVEHQQVGARVDHPLVGLDVGADGGGDGLAREGGDNGGEALGGVGLGWGGGL
jgi:hypothetical protein